MPSNNCVFKCFVLLFISITLTQISKTHSTCLQCNTSLCLDPIDCLHGYVDDDCRCCKVCLKQRGEPCGPSVGKCIKGLKCLSSQHLDPVLTNSVISDKQIGICGVLNCTGVKCQNWVANDNIKCQNDSYKLLSSDSDSCCQTTCVCLPGICNTSQTRCPHNMIARLVRAGDGKPGTCCDQIECIDAPKKCFQNNKEYINGDKWKTDKCTSCECRDGLTFCQKRQCKAITNCNAMAVINDECCPTCQGCISRGLFYNNTQMWFEDDCTHCECNNGVTNCKVQMCSPVHCDQRIIVDGQCCPICSNASTPCDIQCPQGYKHDSSGQQICECNICPNNPLKCKMYCPFGFKIGVDGCELCECLNKHHKQKNTNKAENKSCITNNGTVVANDLFWNDGCRECICSSGKVMCTKPNCPTMMCSNTITIDGKCCPVCADSQTIDIDDKKSGQIGSVHLHSHLFITAIILTLIIAILLLGIFLLLAVYIMKKYPHFKYPRNRVINRSVKENAIIHLWPYSQSSAQVPKPAEKQLIRIRVSNDNNNLLNDSLQIEDVGHSLQEKLLTTCTCPD